ncbi:fimbrial protein [Pseudomonas protegens]|uniref:fimbrial protein n=1 Tax=Pseudomonas protegens TaxID=380021 RepID=UPI001B32A4CC|nr:fimbrial protein [Pseudomonas protegens]MBP5107437.1 fimbrial protein [Pseudomonas protegens]MBP5124314.1 fimbrial protein [Pseudomonas protegens]MBP5127301.1 fimbrial protein [Pseudomonas protegens]MBP5147808.1 fimbrial protein [Pseudomonas protegens]
MGKRTAKLSLWIAASLWLPLATAVEDNLYFSGALVNEPCVLAAEDAVVELDFKNIINKDLYLNGRTRGSPITLRLQNCQLGTGKSQVSITFSGNASLDPPGLLVVQSSDVQGLLVGLETINGVPLLLGDTHGMGELVKGENRMIFNAYLQGETKALADKSIGLGWFYASMEFTISYE